MQRSNNDLASAFEFEAATASAFGFLEREYAFRRRATRYHALASKTPDWSPLQPEDGPLSDRAVLVEYEVRDVVVHIIHNPLSELTVQLTWLAKTGPNRADLWHLLTFVRAEELIGQPHWRGRWGEINLRADLFKLAAALERYGGPWLKGDPLRWNALFDWWNAGMPDVGRPA